MKNIRGFTLIELLITVAIAAILMGLAAPSFKRTIQSTTISSGVNTFLADLRFARSEAIRLGGNVVMCRSDAPEAAAPACGAALGSGPDGNGWVSGWIIFHDLDNNGARAATDPLLRIQAANTSIDSIMEWAGNSTPIRFTATGRLLNLNSATALRFGGARYDSDIQRVLCLSLGGRGRIAGDGLSACGTGTEANQ